MRTASLRVVDRNILSRTQVLHCPITKTGRLVGNNYFDFPAEEPKKNVEDESHLAGVK